MIQVAPQDGIPFKETIRGGFQTLVFSIENTKVESQKHTITKRKT